MATSRGKPARTRRRRAPKPVWAAWKTERLLELRLCDLGLKIPGTLLEQRIDRLHEELARRDIQVRPYVWLSDDWFTPDGMTGIAVPFYLAHPRLIRLERKMSGEAEGAAEEWCMRLLRHEAGHVVDHAFHLSRRRRRQQLFGRSSVSYPRFYRPNPYSRSHVQHLEYWYAQAHPDEDFAETFAVWLQPRSQWRKRYQQWPRALRKLEYVDELMQEIAGWRPFVRTRAHIDSISKMRKTLGEHYERKRAAYAREHTNAYDRDLLKLFHAGSRNNSRETAAAFMRRVRRDVVRDAARWTGEHGYMLDHVLKDMIGRSRELRLVVKGSERRIKLDFTILLVKHTVESLYRHRRWMEM